MTSENPIVLSDISDDDDDFIDDIYAQSPVAEKSQSPSSPAMPTRFQSIHENEFKDDGDFLPAPPAKKIKRNCIVCFDGEEEGDGFACPKCSVWTHFSPCYNAHLESSNHVACTNCKVIFPRSQWLSLHFPFELMTKMEEMWKKHHLENEKKSEAGLFHRARGRLAATPFFDKALKAKEEERRLTKQLARQKKLVLLHTERAKKIEQGIVTANSSNTRCFSVNCKGYLDYNLFCALCEKTFCRDCQCPAHLDKSCEKESRANIDLILQETKPCPNSSCQERIFRIDGCFQMWCVKCNTFFDWTSMKILDNPVFKHNPHYLEWKKSQEKNQVAGFDNDGMPLFESVHLAHNEKMSDWPKWSQVSGIRRLVENINESLTEIQNQQRCCETKREEAGIQFTLCKLSTDIPEEIFASRELVHDEKLFKCADQLEKLSVLYNVYFSAKKTLSIHLKNYLQNAKIEQLHKCCVALEQETNNQLDKLYFFPPIGLGRLFAFF